MTQQDVAEVLVLSERLLVASHKGQAECVVDLINKGAKLVVTKYGRSPLHLAAYKGHIEVVRILLKAGCNLDVQDDGEQTALHRAAVVGHADVIGALVQEGCALDRQDKDGNTAVHEVSWHGFSQSVKVLVKAGANVHARNKAGNTALHLACQNGHVQSAKVLLLGGSRPDSKNHAGDTCLHVAARYNHVTMIRILLGAFCSLSEKNLVGDTPLHVAAALNHRRTVHLLLETGADILICNNLGQTALDQARHHNNPEVALTLIKASQGKTFVRGGNLRKRRDKLKAEGRAQSVPRGDVLHFKDSKSPADDTQSSDRSPFRQTGTTKSNTRTGKKRWRRRKPSRFDTLRHRDTRYSDVINKRKCKEQGAFPYASISPHNYRAYQLYTLYRDKDGKVLQAPLKGCRCDPLMSKLRNQLEATKEEMKTEIQAVHDLMNKKMGQLDCKNRHQIQVLDKMMMERASAERSECLQRIKQWALQEQLEAEKRQVSLVNDLKNWCLSELQNMEVRLTAGFSSTELQHSSSAAERLKKGDEAEQRRGPKDPELQREFSVAEGEVDNHYFVLHVESSPDGEKRQTAEMTSAAERSLLSSVQVVRPKERSVISMGTQRKNLDLQGVEVSGARSPSLTTEHSDRVGKRDRKRAKRYKKHSQGRTKPRGDSKTRTQEVLGDQPCGSSVSQDRDRTMEVTQYWSEAVSTQMIQWSEQKVQEALCQANQRAQAESAALMERISCLEDELNMLRTNQHNS